MKKIRSIIQRRTDLINNLSDGMDAEILADQENLLKQILKELKSFEIKDGKIINNLRNKSVLQKIDQVMARFRANEGNKIIQNIVDGANKLSRLNQEYYQTISSLKKVKDLQLVVQKEIAAQLGYDAKGNLLDGGLLRSVASDKTIDNVIKNYIRKSIIVEQQIDDFKENFSMFLIGDEKKSGIVEQQFKKTTGDVFAQVDRLNGYVYSNALDLKYAIYEGGLIETSREFCIVRNGKVFTMDEIMEFDPKVAKPPNYNPIIDLGGYKCRHHLNWIGYELAVRLRPDLQK